MKSRTLQSRNNSRLLPICYWRNAWVFVATIIDSAWGQTVFNITSLPHDTGNVLYAYVGVSILPTNAFFISNEPQTWTFSQLKATSEVSAVREIVVPATSGFANLYPAATYVERDTKNDGTFPTWSFYSLEATGRIYYGFVDPESNSIKPDKQFSPPTPDLSHVIRYGDSWHRRTQFIDIYDAIISEVHASVTFTADASVDAYGIIRLPFGSFEALRVNELHKYVVRDLDFGLPIPTTYFRYLYWLVPGIGKVVEILSEGAEQPIPQQFAPHWVFRAIDATIATGQNVPIAGLQIRQPSVTEVELSWNVTSNALRYRVISADHVEAITNLNASGWINEAELTATNWRAPLGVGSRFFRVLAVVP